MVLLSSSRINNNIKKSNKKLNNVYNIKMDAHVTDFMLLV